MQLNLFDGMISNLLKIIWLYNRRFPANYLVEQTIPSSLFLRLGTPAGVRHKEKKYSSFIFNLFKLSGGVLCSLVTLRERQTNMGFKF